MKIDQNLLDTIQKKFCCVDIDPYLLQNHQALFNLFNTFYHMTIWNDNKDSIKLKESFSKKEILCIESIFLASLNPKYKRNFIIDRIRHKIVQVDEYSSTTGEYYRYPPNRYKIKYPQNSNIGDLIVLTHEYLHHLSSKYPKLKRDTSSYRVYTEMLSILGELKILDFLIENGFSQEEIEIYISDKTTQRFKGDFALFLFVEPLLDIHLSEKKLTEDKLNELLNSNSYYKSIGEKRIHYSLQYLLDHDLITCFPYTHPLGMITAASLHQDRISNKRFSELIDIINTIKVDEFEMLLPQKSNIELANDTIKEFKLKKNSTKPKL